jgi:hypothetical protein
LVRGGGRFSATGRSFYGGDGALSAVGGDALAREYVC